MSKEHRVSAAQAATLNLEGTALRRCSVSLFSPTFIKIFKAEFRYNAEGINWSRLGAYHREVNSIWNHAITILRND